MKSVVTGGAGFIGSALATALIERGDDVVVIDDLATGSRDAVPKQADFAKVDIRDLDALCGAMAGADVVFHQAALKSVPRSVEEPRVVHDTNATGTLNVLLAAEGAGVAKVIYASSSSVYGGATGARSDEGMVPRPLSPYGVSKLAGEYYCSVWAQLGRLDTATLRYFNVFGPGQRADSKYAAVFPAFVSALLQNRAPEIHWDGEQSRDFTFIDDIVQANILAAQRQTPPGVVLNVAGGEPRTVNEVFTTIASILRADATPTYVPKRAGDIRHSYADSSRARELLGWEPATPWEDAVAATIRWFERAT